MMSDNATENHEGITRHQKGLFMLTGLVGALVFIGVFGNTLLSPVSEQTAALSSARNPKQHPTGEGFTVPVNAQELAATRGFMVSGNVPTIKLQENSQTQAVFTDSYIVELTAPSMGQVSAELEDKEAAPTAITSAVEKQEASVDIQQSRFLSSLPSSVRAKNSSVRSAKNGNGAASFSKVLNAVVLKMDEKEVAAVRKISGVKRIERVQIVRTTLAQSVPLIRAPEVWNSTATSTKATGKNVTIGIIDTGIDYTHADLGGCFGSTCKVAGGWDFVNDDADPMDDMGHGTHVAATAAGNGSLKGVAPDATLYAYKVCNNGGGCATDDIIAALERSADPNGDGDFSDHLDIASLSLGGPGDPDDAMSKAVDNAVAAGVVVTVAAGNSGWYEYTVNSPGTARKAITVAATDKSDYLAWFSSRGPVRWTDATSQKKLLVKPDVAAPGVDICAARWAQSFPYGNTSCNGDNTHVGISGTSMATPHVAGLAALLLELHPTWKSAEIKALIRNGATNRIGYTFYETGFGRIDAFLSATARQRPVAERGALGVVKGAVMVSGTARSRTFASYTVSYRLRPEPRVNREFTDLYTSTKQKAKGSLLASRFDTSTVEDGMYEVRLQVKDKAGTVSTDYALMEINNYELTGVGKTFNYVNGKPQDVRGFAAGSVSGFKVTYGSPSGTTLCTGSTLPKTARVICSANFDSVPAGAQNVYLSVLRNGVWFSDAPMKVGVVKELMNGWPKSSLGFPISAPSIMSFTSCKELVTHGFSSCTSSGNWTWCDGTLLNFHKSTGAVRKLMSLSNGSYIPNLGTISQVPNSNLLVSTGPYWGGFTAFDTNGTVGAQWSVETSVFGTPKLFDRSGKGQYGVYINSMDNGGQVKVLGFDTKGTALPGFPVLVPKGDRTYHVALTLPAFLSDGTSHNIGVVNGSFDRDASFTNLNMKIYAHIFSADNTLLKSTLIDDFTGKRIINGGFAYLEAADFNGDGRSEMVIAYTVADADLFFVDVYNPNAYMTYVRMVDSEGNVVASQELPKGYLVGSMAIGSFAGTTKTEPNIVIGLTDSWATYYKSNMVVRLDGALRTVFATTDISYAPTATRVADINIADVDSDGISDILFGYQDVGWFGNDSGISVLAADGTKKKEIRIPTMRDVDYYPNLVIDDFNSDGKVDVTVQTDSFSVRGASGHDIKLYALNLGGKYVPSTVHWSSFLHDNQRTGCFACGALKPPAKPQPTIKATPTSIAPGSTVLLTYTVPRGVGAAMLT